VKSNDVVNTVWDDKGVVKPTANTPFMLTHNILFKPNPLLSQTSFTLLSGAQVWRIVSPAVGNVIVIDACSERGVTVVACFAYLGELESRRSLPHKVDRLDVAGGLTQRVSEPENYESTGNLSVQWKRMPKR
jgi:hypothetical protein